jgi:hypothetical protein
LTRVTTAAPPRQGLYEDPAERRQRLLTERRAVVEVKGTALLPDDPETAPEPVVDDDLADYGGLD